VRKTSLLHLHHFPTTHTYSFQVIFVLSVFIAAIAIDVYYYFNGMKNDKCFLLACLNFLFFDNLFIPPTETLLTTLAHFLALILGAITYIIMNLIVNYGQRYVKIENRFGAIQSPFRQKFRNTTGLVYVVDKRGTSVRRSSRLIDNNNKLIQ
jgi:hypothetical protein